MPPGFTGFGRASTASSGTITTTPMTATCAAIDSAMVYGERPTLATSAW